MMESEAVRNEEEVSKPKSAEPVVEEIIPPSAPTFTEETVDHFKEELKRIDDEKQKKKEALKVSVIKLSLTNIIPLLWLSISCL